jgi:VWFA-related protein
MRTNARRGRVLPESRWRRLLALALLCGAWPAAGTTAPAERPVFPTQSEIVTVDAVVLDGQGQPVIDLTRENFLVTEDGVAQEIATFEGVAVPREVGRPASTPVASPRIVTNAVAGTTGTTFLIVVDDRHMTEVNGAHTRAMVARFLRESAQEGDRVGVVSTATGAAWTGALPGETDDLLMYVDRLKGRRVDAGPQTMTEYEALQLVERGDPNVMDLVEGRYYGQQRCVPGVSQVSGRDSECRKLIQAEAESMHAQARIEREASLEVLQAALETLERMRGRKALLLLSEGFPRDKNDSTYRRVVHAAQRVNAALYFVDVRGLSALTPWSSAEAPVQTALAESERMPSDRVSGIMGNMEKSSQERSATSRYVGVETMADETGGFVVRNTNDLDGGLQRIATESRGYYLLGYHPSSTKTNGHFRKIDIRVARPGLTVRARKGYYAPGPGDQARAQKAGKTPGAAVQTFDTAAGIPLRLASYALEPVGAGKTRVMAVTEVDVSGLSFEQREGQNVGHLDLRLEAIPRDGGERLVHTLSLEAQRPAGGGPVAWRAVRQEFELPAGVYHVRATANEAATGRAAVLTLRIVVPDPASFSLLTPVLTDSVAAPKEAGGAPQPIPVAHQTFAGDSGRPLLCGIEIAGAGEDAGTGQSDVSVRFELKDGQGRKIGGSEPKAMVVSTDGRLRALLELPIAQLPRGDYQLGLVVEDRVAKKTEERWEAFSVERPGDSSITQPLLERLAAALRLLAPAEATRTSSTATRGTRGSFLANSKPASFGGC